MKEGIAKRQGATPNQTTSEHKLPPEFISSFSQLPFSAREKLVRKGISKCQLSAIRDYLRIDYETLASVLGISSRTLHLRKGEEVFSPIISDRIVMILELYSLGVEVMGNIDAFQAWMIRPNTALLNYTPLETIGTHPGLLEVRRMLGRFKTGQY